MRDHSNIPLLNHPLGEPSAFTASNLIEDVRRARQIQSTAVPPLCILEFDGDLTDWLVGQGTAKPFASWPSFHTAMFSIETEGVICGIIARTIGGPYAVLIGEQLAAAGAKLIIGLTSAGRVLPELPSLVVATGAIRDEGASLHYLSASWDISCPAPDFLPGLETELALTGWKFRSGRTWTTDAPYRETKTQLEKWAACEVLAVEMQTASLFAFGAAKGVAVASVAMVSNAVDHVGEQFNTGSQQDGFRIIEACARAFKAWKGQPGA